MDGCDSEAENTTPPAVVMAPQAPFGRFGHGAKRASENFILETEPKPCQPQLTRPSFQIAENTFHVFRPSTQLHEKRKPLVMSIPVHSAGIGEFIRLSGRHYWFQFRVKKHYYRHACLSILTSQFPIEVSP